MTTQIKTPEPSAEEMLAALQAEVAALKSEASRIVDARVAALSAAVRENPLPAIGIAFGLGYLIAILVRS